MGIPTAILDPKQKLRRRPASDTMISRLLLPASVPAQAVHRAAADAQLLAFDATLVELAGGRAEASSVGKADRLGDRTALASPNRGRCYRQWW